MKLVCKLLKFILLSLSLILSWQSVLAQNSSIRPRPLYNFESGRFHGTVNLIGENTWVTAAHVVSNFTNLNQLALSLNLDSQKIKIFQAKNHEVYLDFVLITDKSLLEAQQILNLKLAVPPQNNWQSYSQYSLQSYSDFENETTQTQDTGLIHYTLDSQYLFLSLSQQSQYNWGGSGAAVLSPQAEGKAIGLAQCVIFVSKVGGLKLPFIRSLSSHIILNSTLEQASLQQTRDRRPHYNLENCNPVDSKRGGGG